MYMNNFENSNWVHIVKKSTMLKKMKEWNSELEQAFPQDSKKGGQLEVQFGKLKDRPLTERYTRWYIKTALSNAMRTHKWLIRKGKNAINKTNKWLRTLFTND